MKKRERTQVVKIAGRLACRAIDKGHAAEDVELLVAAGIKAMLKARRKCVRRF